MSETKDSEELRSAAVSTTVVLAAAFVAAVAAMLAWRSFHIEPWAERAASVGAGCEKYAAAGAFGDAFAPVVGLLTALALGAAIASVLMQRKELELQREEMREAREQFAKQALALEHANKLTYEGNWLAWNQQIAELMRDARQLAELIHDADPRNESRMDELKADKKAIDVMLARLKGFGAVLRGEVDLRAVQLEASEA